MARAGSHTTPLPEFEAARAAMPTARHDAFNLAERGFVALGTAHE
jgi:hypothetical protein